MAMKEHEKKASHSKGGEHHKKKAVEHMKKAAEHMRKIGSKKK